jgi:hypothetical protein
LHFVSRAALLARLSLSGDRRRYKRRGGKGSAKSSYPFHEKAPSRRLQLRKSLRGFVPDFGNVVHDLVLQTDLEPQPESKLRLARLVVLCPGMIRSMAWIGAGK